MPELVTEAVEASGSATAQAGGVFLIDLITPGWGSSGYYSADVLEQAARDRVFPAGTQMFVNHQTAQERNDRPEGDLKDLAAVLAEDAVWTGEALQAKARVYGQWREPLTEMKDDIGTSIRASADVEFGEAEGRKGRIIGRLVESLSVDFVTRAGRGGRIVEVLESARDRVNEAAISHGVNEATVNDKREALHDLLKSAYGADRTYVWPRDFDDTTVWFDLETPDESKTWAQTYATTGDVPTALTGDRTEVRPVTTYVPANPAGRNNQESKEDTMAEIQIEESVVTDLREKAGRVTALEAERDTAITERDTAQKELAEARKEVRESKIATVIAEADAEFSDLEVAGLTALAEAHTTDGVLDVAAFKTAVEEKAATKAVDAGAGRVRGNGQRTTSTSEAVTLADLDESLDVTFGGPITKEA